MIIKNNLMKSNLIKKFYFSFLIFLSFINCVKDLPKLPLNLNSDFILTTHNNEIFKSKNFNNEKVKLVFFGFTNCPDICPKTLKRIEKVEQILKYKKDFVFYFITVDPKNDNTENLKKYLNNFKVNSIGLTGTQNNLSKIAKIFGATFETNKTSDSHGHTHSNILHNTQIFLLDKDSNLRYIIKQEDALQKIASLIRLI